MSTGCPLCAHALHRWRKDRHGEVLFRALSALVCKTGFDDRHGRVCAVLALQHSAGLHDQSCYPFYNSETVLRFTQAHMQMQGCRSHMFVYKLGHVSSVRLSVSQPEGVRQEISVGWEAITVAFSPPLK